MEEVVAFIFSINNDLRKVGKTIFSRYEDAALNKKNFSKIKAFLTMQEANFLLTLLSLNILIIFFCNCFLNASRNLSDVIILSNTILVKTTVGNSCAYYPLSL